MNKGMFMQNKQYHYHIKICNKKLDNKLIYLIFYSF